MKLVLASAALAAVMSLPAAFAQEPPPAGTLPLKGTPEAAAAVKADEDRQAVEVAAAKTNGEPVAVEVAKVVESGKRYTTDDLVRAQMVAVGLAPSAPKPQGQKEATYTPSTVPVVERGTEPSISAITASTTDAPLPSQPAKPATAENTAKPEAPPPVDTPANEPAEKQSPQ